MTDLVGIKSDISDQDLVRVDKAIELLMPEAKEFMANNPAVTTTQNDYGWYMGQLSSLKAHDPVATILFANALIRAGGNKAGIVSALKLI